MKRTLEFIWPLQLEREQTRFQFVECAETLFKYNNFVNFDYLISRKTSNKNFKQVAKQIVLRLTKMSHSVRTSLSSGAIIRPTRIQKSVDAALKCKSPLVHHQVLHRAQRHLEARRLSVKAEASTEAVADQTKWGPNHILVAIIDSNPLLGSNSKSTLEMAASISSSGSGKLSILFIDDEGAPAQSDRLQMIQK